MMFRPPWFSPFAFLVAFLLSACAVAAQTVASELWGDDGAAWSSESRLPDFSFAGYRRGEVALPEHAVTHNVKDFGVIGDGVADDTEAFRRAVATVKQGVILIPEGRYVISDIIEITKPNLVLRGASRHTTTLYFPRTLTDVRPNWGATTTGQRTSNYSWSGGFMWAKGDLGSAKLTAIAAPAVRGERAVTVADASGLAVGQDVDLRQQDDAMDSLARHLYTEEPGDIRNLKSRTRASLVARIVSIEGRGR